MAPGCEASGSASTSTCRSVPGAATTARSPPGPTGTTCIEAYLAALRPRDRSRRRGTACRRRRACSSAAARRRCCPPTLLVRGPRRRRPGRRRRGDRRVQPRHGHRRAAGRLPGRRRQPALVRRAVDGAPRAGRARPHPRSGQRASAPSTLRRAAGFDVVQPRPHLRRGGRVARRLASATLDGGAGARPAARQRLRPHRRGRHTAGRRSGAAIPTTTTRPTSTCSPTSCLAAAGLGRTTRSRTGPGPGHECRHNLLYWTQGDYLGFGCAAHSHRAGRRWWNVRTPERYIAARRGGTVDRGRPRGRSTPRRRGVEGLQLSLRTARGRARRGAGGRGRDLDGLVERAGDRARAHASRPAAGQRGRYPAALSMSSGTGWGGGGPM